MKKIILASTIAMMCLSANAFAEDDGYGNDIPAAREEGTVDDGYGNKLPSNGPETKSYGEARSTSSSAGKLNAGFHLGFGFGSLLSYPSDPLYLAYMGKKDDWDNYSIDLGLVVRYRINDLLTFTPEVNLGIGLSTREIGSGYDWKYDKYKVNEIRAFINANVPLMLRVTPLPFLYVEAGARLNFNFSTAHSNDYTDENGESYKIYDPEKGEFVNYSEEQDEWKVNTFIPSLVAGIGGSFRVNNHDLDFGIRFTWDLLGLEKDNKVDFFDEETGKFLTDDKGEKIVVDNATKWMSFQFVVNYYFL